MNISDLLGSSVLEYQKLARVADSLPSVQQILPGTAFTGIEVQRSHREWLDRSVAAVIGPQIAVSRLANSIDATLSSKLPIPAMLGASYDVSSITRLAEAANLTMSFGVQSGIEQALTALAIPQGRMTMALEAANRLTADFIFRDLDRLTSLSESLQQYSGWARISDFSFDHELLESVEEDLAAVRAELALEQPLTEMSLARAVEAFLQRIQAYSESPLLQKVLLGLLMLSLGNAISGVVGAVTTLHLTQGARTESAAEQQAMLLHDEQQTQMLQRLEEQLRTVAEATELRAIITRQAHLRARPESRSNSYTELLPGDIVLVTSQRDGWLRVTVHVPEEGLLTGWVYAKRAKAIIE